MARGKRWKEFPGKGSSVIKENSRLVFLNKKMSDESMALSSDHKRIIRKNNFRDMH